MKILLYLVVVPLLSLTTWAQPCAERNISGLDNEIANVYRAQELKGGLAGGFGSQNGFLYSTAIGEARHDGTPVDPSTTLFRWASVSKTLVGVIAAILATEGTVDLDADISTYYPAYQIPTTYIGCEETGESVAARQERGIFFDFRTCRDNLRLPEGSFITLRQLLSHRAGIQHYTNGYESPEPADEEINDPKTNTGLEWALKYFIGQPLVGIPGQAFSYSTFGFNLAAVVLEHATQKSWPDLVDEYIAGPLGLCSLQPDYEWIQNDQRAEGYDDKGQDTGSDDVSWKMGGGGVMSTMDDFVRYGQALLFNTTWLSPRVRSDPNTGLWAYHNESKLPQGPVDGLQASMGFFLQYSSNGTLSNVAHSGGQPKTRTLLFLNMAPFENQTSIPYGIYFMSNSENFNMDDAQEATEPMAWHMLPSLSQEDGCLMDVGSCPPRPSGWELESSALAIRGRFFHVLWVVAVAVLLLW